MLHLPRLPAFCSEPTFFLIWACSLLSFDKHACRFFRIITLTLIHTELMQRCLADIWWTVCLLSIYLASYCFQDGTYVVYVGSLLTICATLAPILCARDVRKMQTTRVLEETKDFARRAGKQSCWLKTKTKQPMSRYWNSYLPCY